MSFPFQGLIKFSNDDQINSNMYFHEACHLLVLILYKGSIMTFHINQHYHLVVKPCQCMYEIVAMFFRSSSDLGPKGHCSELSRQSQHGSAPYMENSRLPPVTTEPITNHSG